MNQIQKILEEFDNYIFLLQSKMARVSDLVSIGVEIKSRRALTQFAETLKIAEEDFRNTVEDFKQFFATKLLEYGQELIPGEIIEDPDSLVVVGLNDGLMMKGIETPGFNICIKHIQNRLQSDKQWVEENFLNRNE